MTCNLVRHSERRFCCAACERAFSSMIVFDWHRREGRCRDPQDGGFIARGMRGVTGDVNVWGLNESLTQKKLDQIRG